MPTDFLAAVAAVAQQARPPLTVVESSETGSFDDGIVVLRDGQVLWRFVRERSVLTLVAAPEFDRAHWFDVDLLKRLLGHGTQTHQHETRGSVEALRELMQKSVAEWATDLQ